MYRLVKLILSMLTTLKQKIAGDKLGIILTTSIMFISFLAYISRKKAISNHSSASFQQTAQPDSSLSLKHKKNWAKEFTLQIINRNSLIALLKHVNIGLRERIKPLKETHRIQRRAVRKDKEKYLKFVAEAIDEETTAASEVLAEVLKEKMIDMKKFEEAMENYKNDAEVIEILNENAFEPCRGLEPVEDVAEKVLRFEIKELTKERTVLRKYAIEDDVLEIWGVEVGDCHLLAKTNRKLKGLYCEVRALR